MLDLADNDISIDEGAEIPLGEILPELSALEVLGFNAQHAFLTDDIDIVAFLGTHLPPKLSALFLNLALDDDEVSPLGLITVVCHILSSFRARRPQNFADADDVHTQFSNLTSLRYLHIIDHLESVDLKQQLLEDHPDTLQLVGYNTYLRWIEHDPESNLPKYSVPWPEPRSGSTRRRISDARIGSGCLGITPPERSGWFLVLFTNLRTCLTDLAFRHHDLFVP